MGSFSRSLRQYYSARLLSEAGFFCLLVWYLVMAIPFYLSFSTENFWLNPNVEFVPVSYLFTGKYIANVQYLASTGMTTFTTSNIPSLQFSAWNPTAPSVSLTGVTTTPTTHSIRANINLALATQALTQVELLLFYQLTIPILNAKYTVTSVVNVPWGVKQQAATLTGLLDYSNKDILSAIATDQIDFNFAPYLSDFSYLSNYTLIKDRVYASNYMTTTSILSQDSTVGSSNAAQLTLQLVSKPQALLTYYRGFLQTLKMAFSQYLSLWLISFALGSGLLALVARNGVFSLNKQCSQLPSINNVAR